MTGDQPRQAVRGVGTGAANAAALREEPLGRLAQRLMLAAGCHIIPAPALAPDPPTRADALAKLRTAMLQLRSRDGVGPGSLFWTDPSMIGSGEIARALSAALQPGEPVQGVLALVAETITGPLIYFSKRSPVRVAVPIEGDLQAGGPYLVLAVCEVMSPGRMMITRGHAVAVASSRRLMPVASELERDVVEALVHLQAALDQFGMECDVSREHPVAGDGLAHFCVTNRFRGAPPQEVSFAVAPHRGARAGSRASVKPECVVTAKEWCDGTFMAWLIDACGRAATVGPSGT